MKRRTRYSFFYLAGYLSLTGVGLLLVPDTVLRLLFSNREYDDVFVRFSGMLMIGLAIFVGQMIRQQVTVLYPTTIFIRLFFMVCIVWFYGTTRDPLFLVVLAVVGLGVGLSLAGLMADRSSAEEG